MQKHVMPSARQTLRVKTLPALKEARESLYWIELLKRNNYIDERQYQSIYEDCEELVKILVTPSYFFHLS